MTGRLATLIHAVVLAASTIATFTMCERVPSTPSSPPPPSSTPPSGIRFLGGTLAAGSTVPVSPLSTDGQQASLAFTAAITLDRDLSNALVRAWVSTSARRCMGGGIAGVAFQAGRERTITPATLSNPGSSAGQAVCPLPYDTSLVEFEVLDGGTVVIQQQFPLVYHFVRSPS